jgi:hypothetical protein
MTNTLSSMTAQRYWLDRASCTAAQKSHPPRGMLIARIMPVIRDPNSGSPEDSSKIEPTAAIAETQDAPKNKPLFGVIMVVTDFSPLGDWFNCLRGEAVFV